MSRRKLADMTVDAARRRDVLAFQIKCNRLGVNLARDSRMLQQGLQFRTENQGPVVPVVVQRLYADVVARQEQALVFFVPDGEREHPVNFLQHVHAVLGVGVYQGFGIATCLKRMSERRQFLAQRGEIVDFTVEYDSDVSITAEHGLRAANGIDDAEAAVPEVDVALLKVTLAVRPPMADGFAHSSQRRRRI